MQFDRLLQINFANRISLPGELCRALGQDAVGGESRKPVNL